MSERKMSVTQQEGYFLYGSNRKNEVESPAVRAGEYEENNGIIDHVRGVGFYYDQILQKPEGISDKGAVTEEEAKDAWFMGIMMALHDYHSKNSEFALVLAEEGIEVAKELGWIQNGK